MPWSDAVPNLLIGLREGLEAGLVVTILLAAVRKSAERGQRASAAGIWLGVLGAVMVAGSLAAVLTFSTDALLARWQEAAAGILSVLAVGLVTVMIFWMRRTAAALSGELRGKVESAVAVGAGALALTAFLAVGREGLETTLFLWTAARAAGDTLAPLAGAAIGLAAAITLCWLLFRRAIKINLGTFFSRTAIALIVIAAGVLAYGLGDLQDAGLLSGHAWVAFDVSAQVDASSWWASIITGVTELAPRMTVLQAAAWLAYLAVVIPAFVLAGRRPRVPGPAAAQQAAAQQAGPPLPGVRERLAARAGTLATRRPWVTAGVLVVVPAAAAGIAITALPPAVAPVTLADLRPAAAQYRAYVRPELVTLAAQVARLRADLRAGHLGAARRDWLPAQLTWDRIGAAYDSFGALGDAIDGLPQGLPKGVDDPRFTGLHRLEYGLWHGQRAAALGPVAARLAADVARLRVQFPRLTIDPADLPVRAHEILEDALRDRLTEMADEGSGTEYPQVYADLQGTRVVLGELVPLIRTRVPGLLPAAARQQAALGEALLGTRDHGRWRPMTSTPLLSRQHVDAAIGALLETLSEVPGLLEVPPHG